LNVPERAYSRYVALRCLSLLGQGPALRLRMEVVVVLQDCVTAWHSLIVAMCEVSGVGRVSTEVVHCLSCAVGREWVCWIRGWIHQRVSFGLVHRWFFHRCFPFEIEQHRVST
jgi:hypothetical protein